MKIIKSEGLYHVYSDGIEAFDKLPARSYHVSFSDKQGFYLTIADDVKNTEKVYGDLNKNADRVFNAYDKSTRSIGVLMSGNKGIGKTMMARIMCERANAMGLPVIIVSFNKPGLAHFLGTITQPALVLFDEFEKMFDSRQLIRDEDSSADAGGTPEMLSLLDGLYNNKWLFVFTCNKVYNISTYLVGRPGRIHYHFKFSNPTDEEIREYLEDNIPDDKKDQIQSVVAFSRYAEVNYDALRAIAFEFNLGNDFDEFIGYLNIDRKYDNSSRTYIFVTFNTGLTVCGSGGRINLYDGKDKHSWSLGSYKAGTRFTESTRLVEFIYDEKFIRPDKESNDGTFEIPSKYLERCLARDASPTSLEKETLESIKSGIKKVRIVPDTEEFDSLIDALKNEVSTFETDDKSGDAEKKWSPGIMIYRGLSNPVFHTGVDLADSGNTSMDEALRMQQALEAAAKRTLEGFGMVPPHGEEAS